MGTNFQGLKKNCIFIDIWFYGFDKSAYNKPTGNLFFVENYKIHGSLLSEKSLKISAHE